MSQTLSSLAQAIAGLVVMSQDLDSMYFSLLNNQVPKLWVKVAYLSLKGLASWIRDLQERVKSMYEWLQTGGPICFWISGFFYPQGKTYNIISRIPNWSIVDAFQKKPDAHRHPTIYIQYTWGGKGELQLQAAQRCSDIWIILGRCLVEKKDYCWFKSRTHNYLIIIGLNEHVNASYTLLAHRELCRQSREL